MSAIGSVIAAVLVTFELRTSSSELQVSPRLDGVPEFERDV